MQEFRTKLTENGRLIIPAACRKLLQLTPGEELLIRVEGQELHITTLKQSLKNAQQLVRKCAKGQSLLDNLIAMRQEEDIEKEMNRKKNRA